MNRFHTIIRALLSLWLLLPLCATAQTTTTALPTTIEGWADRLARFGQAIPQEKVFVHLDNTCYFLGDTIWFAAYTRRTDKDIPSTVSRVLYVELLNQEGYLVERQLVEMREGRGHGNFVLPDTLYGGFYELRAYTRWQLNWGITEKEHTSYAEDWFYSKTMAKDFYRDYEKLYSRVFPVYDKPEKAGEYFHDMTTRPLRRYFSDGSQEPKTTLSLFPEGGHLVAGVPCRVAFEAATETGEVKEGRTLPPPSLLGKGQIPDEGVLTVSRGRGMFTFTPEAGQEYEFTFTDTDGNTAKAKLPAVEADGVALSVERQGDEWVINVKAVGQAKQQPLGMTIMHEGVVAFFDQMKNEEIRMNNEFLKPGVNQVTIFDAEGRIYADRLFFVTAPDFASPSLTISGIKEDYAPFEQASLEVTAPSLKSPSSTGGGVGARSSLSLAVRDAGTSDYTFDTSNILTEMLLASEIRGYVPDPAYFFEADDEEHRTALDLLMMTQGWRRFNWQSMATPGAFELSQPAETQTQILRGEVLNYSTRFRQDDVKSFGEVPVPYAIEEAISHLTPDSVRDYIKGLRNNDTVSIEDEYENLGQGEIFQSLVAEAYARERSFPAGSYQMNAPIATSRFFEKEGSLGNEVRVHAEFAQPGSESVIGDVETRQGQFNIRTPHFNNYCVFFLAASDTTKWKSPRHTWIDMDETRDPEFYLRIAWPYPRFTQAYNHYQTSYREVPADAPQASQTSLFNPKTFETQMSGITVRARRGGLRRFDASAPAMVIDAYEAFNEVCDAGLTPGIYGGRIPFINSVARAYVGDMNTTHAYLLETRYDGSNISRHRSGQAMNRFNQLTNLDSVRVYTDFHPRYGADPRATEDNIDRVSIDLRQMPDEGQRVTYRDRRYVLPGFVEPDEFYCPDYSRHPLPEGQADYRRTLYWNPDLQLDNEGRATVTFFTGSKPTTITVEANGQAADGTLLTN